MQPDIAYTSFFDFLTGKESKGWQSVNLVRDGIRNPEEVRTHLKG